MSVVDVIKLVIALTSIGLTAGSIVIHRKAAANWREAERIWAATEERRR